MNQKPNWYIVNFILNYCYRKENDVIDCQNPITFKLLALANFVLEIFER